MPRWLVIGVAAVALVGAAVFERVTSGVQSGDVRAAAAKLDGVPSEFGDWTSTEVPMDDKVLRVAEAAGHVSRTYANRKTGAQVSVLLLCGPTGPIGAHEPKYCYAGNGFGMSGQPQKKAVAPPGCPTATYWSVLFDKKSAASDNPVRVCWMWGADGEWQAATDPRTEYALRKALYKLYVSRLEPRAPAVPGAPAPLDPVHAFLTDFLPEVNKALTAPSAAPK
jgi:hypothetical protein